MISRFRLAFALALTLPCIAARAQMLPPDQTLLPFTRYMAVRERMIVGFDTPGVRVGSFTLKPTLDVTGNYNDNAFALQNPRIGAGYVAISPGVQLQSNFSNRSLDLNVSSEIDRFFTHTSENTESVNVSAYGTQDLGSSTRVRGIVRYNQQRESRESENSFSLTERPIRYEQETGAIGLSHRFARVLISGDAGVTRSHFFDARRLLQNQLTPSPLDPLLSEQYRNNDNLELKLRAEIAQSQALSYFAQVTRDATSYDRDLQFGFGRESKNYEVLGGVRFELPVLARGEIGIGYQDSSYRGAQFSRSSGLAVNSTVMFFPTQLLTVTVDVRRAANNAGLTNAASYVQLSGGAHVDYELLRTLILGAGVQLERDTFNGIDRRDARVGFNGTVDWRFTPRLWLRGGYDRLDLSSNGIKRYNSFVRNRFTLGIGIRL